jgi:hypothetical protein
MMAGEDARPIKSRKTYHYREWTKSQAKAKMNNGSKNQAMGKSKKPAVDQ